MEAANPEEIQLRHVEKDVLIPKMMREKAKERCAERVAAFNHCCKESGFFMVFKCREENSALKECLTLHYNDPTFFEECKQEYIREKLEFERTGIPTKNRKQKLPTSIGEYHLQNVCIEIQKGLVHSVLGGLLGLQFPIEHDELDAAECPSQNMASLGLGGLGKDLELSSREAWLRGGGGRTTEQALLPPRASSEQLCEGQRPLYQQSSFRLSGSMVPGGPLTGIGLELLRQLETERVVGDTEGEGQSETKQQLSLPTFTYPTSLHQSAVFQCHSLQLLLQFVDLNFSADPVHLPVVLNAGVKSVDCKPWALAMEDAAITSDMTCEEKPDIFKTRELLSDAQQLLRDIEELLDCCRLKAPSNVQRRRRVQLPYATSLEEDGEALIIDGL
ncbi:hypothetical protein INR49_012803, partial [Caranx melampygus]